MATVFCKKACCQRPRPGVWMPGIPMRSHFYLALLGVVLLTIAIVVRSGMLAS